ncbi:hypothetical protein [Streptomyces sp. NPDC057910]|uniref:hypothetical protein n=1 Tax=Streptomyces sp. NPDC057910 TaxID=3346278 RepID=UPI0036EA6B9F
MEPMNPNFPCNHGLHATTGGTAGGEVLVTDDATVTVWAGDARIRAHDNAQVTLHAGADAVHIDAHDAAVITAHSGTITIHSPGVTITLDGSASIFHT